MQTDPRYILSVLTVQYNLTLCSQNSCSMSCANRPPVHIVRFDRTLQSELVWNVMVRELVCNVLCRQTDPQSILSVLTLLYNQNSCATLWSYNPCAMCCADKQTPGTYCLFWPYITIKLVCNVMVIELVCNVLCRQTDPQSILSVLTVLYNQNSCATLWSYNLVCNVLCRQTDPRYILFVLPWQRRKGGGGPGDAADVRSISWRRHGAISRSSEVSLSSFPQILVQASVISAHNVWSGSRPSGRVATRWDQGQRMRQRERESVRRKLRERERERARESERERERERDWERERERLNQSLRQKDWDWDRQRNRDRLSHRERGWQRGRKYCDRYRECQTQRKERVTEREKILWQIQSVRHSEKRGRQRGRKYCDRYRECQTQRKERATEREKILCQIQRVPDTAKREGDREGENTVTDTESVRHSEKRGRQRVTERERILWHIQRVSRHRETEGDRERERIIL